MRRFYEPLPFFPDSGLPEEKYLTCDHEVRLLGTFGNLRIFIFRPRFPKAAKTGTTVSPLARLNTPRIFLSLAH